MYSTVYETERTCLNVREIGMFIYLSRFISKWLIWFWFQWRHNIQNTWCIKPHTQPRKSYLIIAVSRFQIFRHRIWYQSREDTRVSLMSFFECFPSLCARIPAVRCFWLKLGVLWLRNHSMLAEQQLHRKYSAMDSSIGFWCFCFITTILTVTSVVSQGTFVFWNSFLLSSKSNFLKVFQFLRGLPQVWSDS